MSKKQPFYKTGPLFYKSGAMSPLNNDDELVTSSLEDSSNPATGTETETESGTQQSNEDLGRNIGQSLLDPTGRRTSNDQMGYIEQQDPPKTIDTTIDKGTDSTKVNRDRRKENKLIMKSQGESKMDIRQTKLKSKRSEIESYGKKSQYDRDRIKRLKRKEARIEGRKTKKQYIKNN